MSESKHTPGPWAVRYDTFDDAWHVVPFPDNPPTVGEWAPVCVLGSFEVQEEANARLIAAAPELLAALQGAIGALEFSRDFHGDLGNEEQAFAQDKLDAALNAICKAEGGQS